MTYTMTVSNGMDTFCAHLMIKGEVSTFSQLMVIASPTLSVAYSAQFSSVQFSSVQDGTHAFGKAHMRSTPSLRSFPPMLPSLKQFHVGRIDDGPFSSSQGDG